MKIRMSEALEHLKQLISQGCEYPQAVYDTAVAFELDREAVEMLEDCYDYELMVGHYG
jgi:hypothetical protein